MSSDEELWPEHTKLHKIVDTSHEIGAFLEWASLQGLSLCLWNDEAERYELTGLSIEATLAAYFGIDLKALEAEKRLMLERFRSGLSE